MMFVTRLIHKLDQENEINLSGLHGGLSLAQPRDFENA